MLYIFGRQKQLEDENRHFIHLLHNQRSNSCKVSNSLARVGRVGDPSRAQTVLVGAAMNSEDQIVQTLQKEVAELKGRVLALQNENEDLRNICIANGVRCDETLDALRHRRYFARMRSEHPLYKLVSASEALGVIEIGQGVVEGSGSLLGLALASRGVFATLRHVMLQKPWRFGFGRVAAIMKRHRTAVHSLAAMKDGQLASVSYHSLRIWDIDRDE